MDNRIKDNFITRVQLDSRTLVGRLKRGNLGKHIESVLQAEEIQRYFEENLVQHCVMLARTVSPQKRDFFKQITEAERLWKNLSINLANNVLHNCINLWLFEEETSFDELVVQFVTEENVKHLIDALQTSFTEYAEGLNKVRIVYDQTTADKRLLN